MYSAETASGRSIKSSVSINVYCFVLKIIFRYNFKTLNNDLKNHKKWFENLGKAHPSPLKKKTLKVLLILQRCDYGKGVIAGSKKL